MFKSTMNNNIIFFTLPPLKMIYLHFNNEGIGVNNTYALKNVQLDVFLVTAN